MYINLDNNYEALSSSWEKAEMNIWDILAFSWKTLLFFYWDNVVWPWTESLEKISHYVKRIAVKGVIIMWISTDKIEKLESFISDWKLQIDLMSDHTLQLHKELGITIDSELICTAALLNEQGEVLKQWDNVLSEKDAAGLVNQLD